MSHDTELSLAKIEKAKKEALINILLDIKEKINECHNFIHISPLLSQERNLIIHLGDTVETILNNHHPLAREVAEQRYTRKAVMNASCQADKVDGVSSLANFMSTNQLGLRHV